jgi:hypothetical protein
MQSLKFAAIKENPKNRLSIGWTDAASFLAEPSQNFHPISHSSVLEVKLLIDTL